MYRVGDRIFTRYKYHGTRRLGTVSHTDGPNLIYVSLDYLQTGIDDDKKDVEVYPNEIDPLYRENEDGQYTELNIDQPCVAFEL